MPEETELAEAASPVVGTIATPPKPRGKTLRDLIDERIEITAYIAEAEGELTPEMEAALDNSAENISEKIDRVCSVIRHRENDAALLGDEIKRLAARKKAAERDADYLKNRVLAEALVRLGPPFKMVTLTNTIAMQLNNPRLDGEVSAEQLAAASLGRSPYVIRSVVYALDKKTLLADAKDHPEEVEAFGLAVVRDESVRIR
jgi:hypothetical protein